ncbi:Protein of unknown function [Arboricoccus pini]|uniref:DUF1499 domain-containing protein n=1 Tax=Arboricoccus pini TaxID=1963835 RepID=A0A212R0F5_9PROT|nr:DUF1499 domain-containing protein [Arboricoccus pini]SNB65472.1 Protein of unknown function [Arboricoccus pini]
MPCPDVRHRPLWPAVLIGLACLGGCTSPTTDEGLIDPTTVERSSTPNDYLACLASACQAEVDVPTQIFVAPATKLFQAWRDVIAAQPRTVIRNVDEKRLLLSAEESSPVFGLVDELALKVIPVSETTSTFALYSRSRSGFFDFGANKSRVADLIVDVRRHLGGSG